MNTNVDRYFKEKELIVESRLQESNKDICADNAKQFEELLDYLDTLRFEEKPIYGKFYFSF